MAEWRIDPSPLPGTAVLVKSTAHGETAVTIGRRELRWVGQLLLAAADDEPAPGRHVTRLSLRRGEGWRAVCTLCDWNSGAYGMLSAARANGRAHEDDPT